tara:strand:- start:30 stop:1232 length:1203 start_codon:yes stop_codon:yes gene_type:complete
MAGLLDNYMAQVQDYKKAGSIGSGLLPDRPNLELGRQGLLGQMQAAESEYLKRVSDPLPYYQQNPEAQGLLNVSPELDLIDAATGGGKATFIGQMAKTFNKRALTLAKEMTSKGASRDDVWKATGSLGSPTFKDVDGKWKQEISDDAYQYVEPTSLNSSIGGMPDSLSSQLDMMRNASDKELDFFTQLVDYKGSPSQYQAESLKNIYGEMNDITKGKFLSGHVNIHPQFSSAYPDIDLSEVQYRNTVGFNDSVKGSFDQDTGNSILKANDPEARSTMAHERQHYIQEQEDFARGGSAVGPFQSGQFKQLMSQMVERLKNNPANKDVSIEDIHAHARRLVNSPDERVKAYKNLAGEAEARNVQKRLDYTMDERINSAPWETRDVLEKDLTVAGLLSSNRYD